MKRAPLKPGNPAPISAQYQVVGPRGGHGPEVTLPKGHTLPPAPKGSTYKPVDPTKNGSGKV